jgi:hypothetical protein
MRDGTFVAMGMLLMLITGMSLFVAFHPGGIESDMFITSDNPNGYAQNPADVIRYFLIKGAEGKPTDTGGTTPGDTGVSEA